MTHRVTNVHNYAVRYIGQLFQPAANNPAELTRAVRFSSGEPMTEIYLGLGTNLGDRRHNLRQAVRGLAPAVEVTAVSPVYATEPWGIVDQPEFLNMCVGGHTDLTPRALLHFVKALETALGRELTVRWGPRLIDIDILFYGDLILNEEGLQIPHPGLAARASVLAPLRDIAPEWVHPQLGRRVAELLTAVDTAGVTKTSPSLFNGKDDKLP
jgi:2-amino-4-hydroxy-6-hydroxymethyldihydropteridine diphosphokinase